MTPNSCFIVAVTLWLAQLSISTTAFSRPLVVVSQHNSEQSPLNMELCAHSSIRETSAGGKCPFHALLQQHSYKQQRIPSSSSSSSEPMSKNHSANNNALLQPLSAAVGGMLVRMAVHSRHLFLKPNWKLHGPLSFVTRDHHERKSQSLPSHDPELTKHIFQNMNRYLRNMYPNDLTDSEMRHALVCFMSSMFFIKATDILMAPPNQQDPETVAFLDHSLSFAPDNWTKTNVAHWTSNSIQQIGAKLAMAQQVVMGFERTNDKALQGVWLRAKSVPSLAAYHRNMRLTQNMYDKVMTITYSILKEVGCDEDRVQQYLRLMDTEHARLGAIEMSN